MRYSLVCYPQHRELTENSWKMARCISRQWGCHLTGTQFFRGSGGKEAFLTLVNQLIWIIIQQAPCNAGVHHGLFRPTPCTLLLQSSPIKPNLGYSPTKEVTKTKKKGEKWLPKKFPGPEIPASISHKRALDLVDWRWNLISSCMIANLYSKWGLRCAVDHPKVVKSVVVYTGL